MTGSVFDNSQIHSDTVSIMQNVFLKDFGGKPEQTDSTKFDNTEAFSKAIGFLKTSGGGTLTVTEGIWHTGPIELFSNITLNLEKNAVISFFTDEERFPPVYTRWEGVDCYAMHPCVFANAQKNVKITGHGIIDGNGQDWWTKRIAKKPQAEPVTEIEKMFAKLNPDYKSQPSGGGGRYIQFLRPPLVQFYKSDDCKIEGITIRNSPFWTVHPVYCKNLEITGITVENPGENAPNTDGIDIDSCTNVVVKNCRINVGDDAIVIKSGAGESGIKAAVPCSHVLVSGCTVHSGHGGIVLGSETAAGINNVVAENCVFDGTDRGIRIKTRRQRGGALHDLTFSNLTIKDSLCPLAINMYYVCGANPKDPYLFSLDAQEVDASTPSIRDLKISGIKATGCKASAGFIAGLPEAPVENLSITDCYIETNESSPQTPDVSDMFAGIPSVTEKSFRIINSKNLSITGTEIKGPAEKFLYN